MNITRIVNIIGKINKTASNESTGNWRTGNWRTTKLNLTVSIFHKYIYIYILHLNKKGKVCIF